MAKAKSKRKAKDKTVDEVEFVLTDVERKLFELSTAVYKGTLERIGKERLVLEEAAKTAEGDLAGILRAILVNHGIDGEASGVHHIVHDGKLHLKVKLKPDG